MPVIPVEQSEEPESSSKSFLWIPCQARNDSMIFAFNATTFGGGILILLNDFGYIMNNEAAALLEEV